MLPPRLPPPWSSRVLKSSWRLCATSAKVSDGNRTPSFRGWRTGPQTGLAGAQGLASSGERRGCCAPDERPSTGRAPRAGPWQWGAPRRREPVGPRAARRAQEPERLGGQPPAPGVQGELAGSAGELQGRAPRSPSHRGALGFSWRSLHAGRSLLF